MQWQASVNVLMNYEFHNRLSSPAAKLSSTLRKYHSVKVSGSCPRITLINGVELSQLGSRNFPGPFLLHFYKLCILCCRWYRWRCWENHFSSTCMRLFWHKNSACLPAGVYFHDTHHQKNFSSCLQVFNESHSVPSVQTKANWEGASDTNSSVNTTMNMDHVF